MSAYCPACGGSVETRPAVRAQHSVSECTTCSFVIDIAGSTDAASEAFEAPSTILFADDSDLLRGAIEAALLEKQLAQSVLGARNGQEFLEVFTWQLKDGNPVQLAMLDVEMPILDGFGAATAMRAVERAFDLRNPTPIVFFSAQPCDARARAVLETCGRAVYINKMASPDLDQLAMRVEAVLLGMLRRRAA